MNKLTFMMMLNVFKILVLWCHSCDGQECFFDWLKHNLISGYRYFAIAY